MNRIRYWLRLLRWTLTRRRLYRCACGDWTPNREVSFWGGGFGVAPGHRERSLCSRCFAAEIRADMETVRERFRAFTAPEGVPFHSDHAIDEEWIRRAVGLTFGRYLPSSQHADPGGDSNPASPTDAGALPGAELPGPPTA